MFKLVVLSALLAVALAAPKPGYIAPALAYSSVVGSVPTSVSHQSSSVVHSAALAHAPVVAAYSAPVVAAHTAYAAPVVAAHTAYAAPYAASYAAPYAAHYAAPYASPYAAPYYHGGAVVY